jgi:hypothetical protein
MIIGIILAIIGSINMFLLFVYFLVFMSAVNVAYQKVRI